MDDLIKEHERLCDLLDGLSASLKLDTKRTQLARLLAQSSAPGFWDAPEQAQPVMQEIGLLQQEVELYGSIQSQLSEAREFMGLGDESMAADIAAQLRQTAASLQSLEQSLLFSGKYDRGDAILAIHAGTGGVDAQDWAAMLERMYVRFGEQQHWEVTSLERSAGEEAGIKSATLEIKGASAYGLLKAEHGVHRLVRLSPFNAKNSRETSFVLVEVIPLMATAEAVNIDEKDLRVDVYRSGGKGGQSVNTTDSAVRITHVPSGLVVTCQNERSQLQNKQKAMQVLRARLQHLADLEEEAKLAKTKGEHVQGSWGNQIRSYVLQPYTMVKDHRTDHETADVQKVLDGDVEPFMLAWLKSVMGK